MTEAPHLPHGAVPDPPVPPATEARLWQFIDIGSGLPTVGNTHQVVQRIDPAARVVYADLDPMVAAQSEPLLAGPPNVTLINADLRDPEAVLGHPAVRSMIDFSEPTGLYCGVAKCR